MTEVKIKPDIIMSENSSGGTLAKFTYLHEFSGHEALTPYSENGKPRSHFYVPQLLKIITVCAELELCYIWIIETSTSTDGKHHKWKSIRLGNRCNKNTSVNVFIKKANTNDLMKCYFDSTTKEEINFSDLQILSFKKGLDTLFKTCEKVLITFEINLNDEKTNQNKKSCDHIKYYKELLKTKKYSDVLFVVGEEEIPAHKVIISSYSHEFATMLDSKTFKIKITDIEPSIFKLFLHFIYCQEVDSKDTDDLLKLIKLANRYSVLSLMKDCADILSHSLSVDNVADVFITANLVSNAELLKKECTNFIVKNKKEVSNTHNYKRLVQFYPNLVIELWNSVMETD